MKVRCDFDLGWFDDNETLDSAVEGRIIQEIAGQMPKSILEKIEKRASDLMAEKVDATIDAILERFMNREILVTDKWGDVQEKHESVNELLKAKFDNFVSQKVDSNGHPIRGCAYGKTYTRIEYLIDDRIKKAAESFTKEIIAGVQQQLKKHLDAQVKKGTEDAFKKAIGLDSILKD